MVSKKLKSRGQVIETVLNNHAVFYIRLTSYIPPNNRTALSRSLIWSVVVYIHKVAITNLEKETGFVINFYNIAVNRLQYYKTFPTSSTNKVPALVNQENYVGEVFSGRDDSDLNFIDIGRIILIFSGNGAQDLDILTEELNFEYDLIYKTLLTNKDLFTPPN